MKEVRFHVMVSASALLSGDSEVADGSEREIDGLDERGKIVCTMSFRVRKEEKAYHLQLAPDLGD